jgi:hypothetical protein
MTTATPEPTVTACIAGDDMPWHSWTTPRIITTTMDQLSVRDLDGGLMLAHNGEVQGPATRRGLQELSWKVGFDAGFILDKLPRQIGSEVINHRIGAYRADKEVAVILEDNQFTAFLPSARQILPYAETAQTAYETMREAFGEVQIDHASVAGQGGMNLRLLTDLDQPITRRVGDSLQMGILVRQDYGETIDVSLYLRRLICLNGMTSNQTQFSWQNKFEGSREHQRTWLSSSIAEALGAYEGIVDRSRQMASTRFEGDPESALRERARAMGFPARHLPALFAAYAEEPGQSEWDLLNAVTRVATHAGLPNNLGPRLQTVAGDWARSFDVVTARMPRPLAVSVGARILEQINETPNDEE